MAQTPTEQLSSLTFKLPSGPATLVFPKESSPDEAKTIINRIPAGSNWTTPLHWHETHTEFFRVTKGFARVTIGKNTLIIGPDEGSVAIRPYVVHGFGRADTGPLTSSDQKLVAEDSDWTLQDVEVEEWTEPADGLKEIFFRNGISQYVDELQPVIVEGKFALRDISSLISSILRSIVFQSRLDNYPVLCGTWGIRSATDPKINLFGRILAYALFGVAKMINAFTRWRLWSTSYVPTRYWDISRDVLGEPQKSK